MRWDAWTMLIAGLWLVMAPFVLGYSTLSTVATAEAVIAGIAIAGFALWLALSAGAPAYVTYLLALAGLWSMAAPFALGYSGLELARNSDLVAGLFVTAIAIGRAVYALPKLRQKAA